MRKFIIALTIIAGFCFLAGVDSALDKEASKAERFNVYCRTPGHSDNLCRNYLR